MPALVVQNGKVVWSSSPLVLTADANAYAAARGWTDWAAAVTAGTADAAILDASTFIRAYYGPPSALTAEAELSATSAVIEAARLALASPLLGGDQSTQAVIREKVGPLETQYAAPRDPSAVRDDRLALVTALLIAAGARPLSGINHPLRRV